MLDDQRRKETEKEDRKRKIEIFKVDLSCEWKHFLDALFLEALFLMIDALCSPSLISELY